VSELRPYMPTGAIHLEVRLGDSAGDEVGLKPISTSCYSIPSGRPRRCVPTASRCSSTDAPPATVRRWSSPSNSSRRVGLDVGPPGGGSGPQELARGTWCGLSVAQVIVTSATR